MPGGYERRRFLRWTGGLLLGSAVAGIAGARAADRTDSMTETTSASTPGKGDISLFLSGDVMTARGIDQILPYSVDPVLHEPFATSALDYLRLAERAHGAIPRPVDFGYIWGDALAEWARVAPDVRIANLETSLTTRDDWQRGKGIHYRMHPANAPVLAAAGLDCCVLANNHVLDWGGTGLAETLQTLDRAGIKTAGAGRDRAEAEAPAVMTTASSRVLVFAFGTQSSGIAADWGASAGQPGVNLLADLSAATLRRIAAKVKAVRRPGDVVVASIHWGGNWGYAVPAAHREFAHGLIEQCAVDVVHGHSSHHPLGIEVHRGRPILYGCGDFINDYEGISGHEAYRGDLSLMYFLKIDPPSGRLSRLWMVPMQMRRFRLQRASAQDTRWLCEVLDRESRLFGSRVVAGADSELEVRW
jgi:poly-gamma-glutamate capsule biosynthesis protein CapA/YwtB (metallophosphatase superfamily)